MPAILLFLKSIPLSRWLQLGAALAVAGAFAVMGVMLQDAHLETARAQAAQARAEKATQVEKAGRAADNARAQAAAASAAQKSTADTLHILNDQQEIEDANRLIASQRQAVVAAADAVHRSLLDAAQRAASAAGAGGAGGSGDAAVVAGGGAGQSPGHVLADVLGELDARAGALAATLDGEFDGHAACAAEYRSVQSRVNGQRAVTP
ncbi:MAG TPA: hypothetical protein VIP05_22920 [Burkholderiaceae bacterium]